MLIWVDITTPAQVLLFRPIIRELQTRGRELVITTRHSTETVPLADQLGLSHTMIGRHGGGNLIGKGSATVLRALRLSWFLRGRDVSLAVSSSSFSQALTAALMHIPFVALNDYEGNPGMHIVCRTAKKIIVPYPFSKANLYRYGASEDRIESYSGLKESVYLSEFLPDPLFFKREGIPPEKIIVAMRPASEVAAYHQFENTLFSQVLEFVTSHEDTFLVLLPRTLEQRWAYEALQSRRMLIPTHVLDGPNLIHHSDLVIGAGGTMNREAVVLGTPVYTLFQGMLGSVDQYLIDSGKMVHVKDTSDIPRIKLQKKESGTSLHDMNGRSLPGEIVEKLLRV